MEKNIWEERYNNMKQEKEKLIQELKSKEKAMNLQDQRIEEVAREMTLSLVRSGLQTNTTATRGNEQEKLVESRQKLAKLHLEYEYRMEKMKSFVKRESERFQADARRLESEFKVTLNNIYKDTSIIFRALNRFKECVAALFDRESKFIFYRTSSVITVFIRLCFIIHSSYLAIFYRSMYFDTKNFLENAFK